MIILPSGEKQEVVSDERMALAQVEDAEIVSVETTVSWTSWLDVPLVPPVIPGRRIPIPGDEPPPIPNGGRPVTLPRRRLGTYATPMLALVTLVAVVAAAIRWASHEVVAAPAPIRLAPTVVYAPIRLEGALVRGAARDWAIHRNGALHYGEPVPVELTAYCLHGLTRRDHYVRQGIVASDPTIFPLGRYIEVYVGRKYFGRFLVDDTGRNIKKARLDIWTPTCREARLFGRTKGTAVLVPRPRGAAKDTLLTGRLGGAAK